jgi:CRISPR/Cas system-associated endonuclease Cas1
MAYGKTCLIIDSRKMVKISIDGPALKICMESQSPRLFPLRRLSRIHIIGDPTSGLNALLYCAEHQVPVAFFTAKGKLRCQLFFPVFEGNFISHWIEHVEWLHHEKLRLLAPIGIISGSNESRAKLAEEMFNKICKYAIGESQYKLATDWLMGMLATQMSQIIVNHGIANQSRSKKKLMDDLLPLYRVWIKHSLSNALKTEKLNISAATMSALYQQLSEDIDYQLRRSLTQLSSRLEAII